VAEYVRDDDNDDNSVDRLRGSSGEDRSLSFSLVQYHTLLDLFGNDPLVRAVIARHAAERRIDGGDHSYSSSLIGDGDVLEQYSIDSVRSGKVLHSLNLSTPPLVSYASQLRNKMSSSDEPLKGDQQRNDDDGDDDGDYDYGGMDDCELGLHIVVTAITNQKESKGARIIGDNGAAIDLLTDDLLEFFDDDDDDDDEDDKDEDDRHHVERIKSLVPTHLKVTLLTER